MKILDRYIIKTFFGPFMFIFSVLFFILMINTIWIQMSQFIGKGLTYWEIIKMLFYFSVALIQLVVPLTILLASIMAFGDFGERYELAAMKAAGISLTRVMKPLFIVSTILAIILFFFQNNVTPDFQRKAKNMGYNVAVSKPALNFTAGQFISQIPGYSVKFDKIYGEQSEKLDGIYIHKTSGFYDDQQTVIAKKGEFAKAVDKNYIKLLLYDGYVYEDNYRNKTDLEKKRQPNQSVKFDTLVLHFDISELIDRAIEEEQITDDYRFQTYNQISTRIETQRKNNTSLLQDMSYSSLSNTNSYISVIEKDKEAEKKITKPQYQLDTLQKNKKVDILLSAYQKLDRQKLELAERRSQVDDLIYQFNKMIMYQQRIFAYSFTCIIFFLIGASLGSIIRKGGVGLPVVIAIVIFIIFYVMNLTVENLSWKGNMNPYLATWLPNMILFPFSVWLTVKALTDSQLFDLEKYKALLKPITHRFTKSKEHKRYQ